MPAGIHRHKCMSEKASTVFFCQVPDKVVYCYHFSHLWYDTAGDWTLYLLRLKWMLYHWAVKADCETCLCNLFLMESIAISTWVKRSVLSFWVPSKGVDWYYLLYFFVWHDRGPDLWLTGESAIGHWAIEVAVLLLDTNDKLLEVLTLCKVLEKLFWPNVFRHLI